MRLVELFIFESQPGLSRFTEENIGSETAEQLFAGSVQAIMQRNGLTNPDDVTYDVIDGELFAFGPDVEMSYWVPRSRTWEYS